MSDEVHRPGDRYLDWETADESKRAFMMSYGVMSGFRGSPSERDYQMFWFGHNNSNAALWAHLVSRHAGFYDPTGNLIEMHEHEHRGPGTIRNHDYTDRSWDIKGMIGVLQEQAEDIPCPCGGVGFCTSACSFCPDNDCHLPREETPEDVCATCGQQEIYWREDYFKTPHTEWMGHPFVHRTSEEPTEGEWERVGAFPAGMVTWRGPNGDIYQVEADLEQTIARQAIHPHPVGTTVEVGGHLITATDRAPWYRCQTCETAGAISWSAVDHGSWAIEYGKREAAEKRIDELEEEIRLLRYSLSQPAAIKHQMMIDAMNDAHKLRVALAEINEQAICECVINFPGPDQVCAVHSIIHEALEWCSECGSFVAKDGHRGL